MSAPSSTLRQRATQSPPSPPGAPAFAFSAQIYFDFSGYSDMAIGLGLLFNFRLPVNFAAPLRATSILDFWRRWHITLSQWLRDYIYGPLTFGRPMGWWRAIAVMITMTLAGLWHGAGWTFVVWGAYHGCLLIINTIWQRVMPEREEPTRAGQLVGWALTFTAFVVGAVFFRAADIETSWRLLAAMGGMRPPPDRGGNHAAARLVGDPPGLDIGGLHPHLARQHLVGHRDRADPAGARHRLIRAGYHGDHRLSRRPTLSRIGEGTSARSPGAPRSSPCASPSCSSPRYSSGSGR